MTRTAKHTEIGLFWTDHTTTQYARILARRLTSVRLAVRLRKGSVADVGWPTFAPQRDTAIAAPRGLFLLRRLQRSLNVHRRGVPTCFFRWYACSRREPRTY